eukprot:10982654-Heterocapsa_arctica.AAC.1
MAKGNATHQHQQPSCDLFSPPPGIVAILACSGGAPQSFSRPGRSVFKHFSRGPTRHDDFSLGRGW